MPDTDCKLRTQAERDALFVLFQILFYQYREEFLAGLLTDWLSKYPFGGAGSSPSTKQEVVERLSNGETDDVEMGNILAILCKYPEGRRQLQWHGLVANARSETPDSMEFVPGERVEASTQERARRRRRREAMVLSEGSQPIGDNDIIQPGQRTEEW